MTVEEGRRRDVKEQRANWARACMAQGFGESEPALLVQALAISYLSILLAVSLWGWFFCKLRVGWGLGGRIGLRV